MYLSDDETTLRLDLNECEENLLWMENQLRDAINKKRYALGLTDRGFGELLNVSYSKLLYQMRHSLKSALINLLIIASKFDLDGELTVVVTNGDKSHEVKSDLKNIEVMLSEYGNLLVTQIYEVKDQKGLSIRHVAEICGLTLGKLRHHLQNSGESSLPNLILIADKMGLKGSIQLTIKPYVESN